MIENETFPAKTAAPEQYSGKPFATPTAKPQPVKIFGLFTPGTPPANFSSTFEQSPTFAAHEHQLEDQDEQEEHTYVDVDMESNSDTDAPTETYFDEIHLSIREAELVGNLVDENETPGKRRSTRLAKKESAKVTSNTALVPARHSKSPKSTTVTRDISPPTSSFTNEATVQLLPEANPGLLTLDWQLQYPPGGSTHPSYAYPRMDPRLVFDPALIPVVDGLPIVFHLPPLVLPMHWRHVSWSGYLPIVFDPNQQAFKLTPIGPLPLTCEEVQQNGLAKYVPGGTEHPEAGMLPDMRLFVDGSDNDKFNFDGVDWVLPWPQGETFGNSLSGGMDAGALSESNQTSLPHYIEARDCPDDVVDIAEAWRWISEKDKGGAIEFKATIGKTWRGTGIRRAQRRFKNPIASLLASAIADTLELPNNPYVHYLINQNTREFCPFRSVATPVYVNIALLEDTEFTLKELLCYFPSHYQWRKCSDRLLKSGMSKSDIANMINMTRQLSEDASRKRDSIGNAIDYEPCKSQNGDKTRVRIVRDFKDGEAQSYSAEGWTNEFVEPTDYPLFGLTHGLAALPEGPDAGPLTMLIEWCREHNKYDVMLSNVTALLHEAGIASLIEPGEHGCPDKEMLPRYSEMLKQDRKRVLKAAAERKRILEENEENKGKKMRSA
ncbi:hypothetical protein GQ44DRAFT_784542 [Phaeosphaeriaceae sp. PMI808]|nr:hypothetical protein GQ44DRAFT_784542 [Phaeosphaeriaceae sp. PMI808]